MANADVVLWYNMGLTHIARPEDFPIMPVEVIGFRLSPSGFFSRSPAIDLPPTRNAASREATGGGCCGNSGAGAPAVAHRSKL